MTTARLPRYQERNEINRSIKVFIYDWLQPANGSTDSVTASGTAIQQNAVRVSVRNVSLLRKRAIIGEVSGPTLSDTGCRYVLPRHTERQALFGESGELVALHRMLI